MTPLACNWSSNDLIWDSESCFLNSALIVLESVFTVRGRAGVRLFRSARIKSTSARVTLARGPRILRLTPRSGHWKSPFWLRTTRSFSLRLIRPKSRLMALQHATQFSSELLPPLVVAIKCSTLCASSTSFSLSNSSGAPDGVLRQKKRSRSETLGLTVESGEPIRFNTAIGSFEAYGHSLTLETLRYSFDVTVYLAAEESFKRNVLGVLSDPRTSKSQDW